MKHVDVDVADAESRRLWGAIADLTGRLPGDWVLVGGLMVSTASRTGTSAASLSSICSPRIELRRPTLLGATLIKCRSLMGHADPATQREDLLTLLSLATDPRSMAAS